MSLEFLKEILRMPKLDDLVENSKHVNKDERMSLIGFDKVPVLLNYFHSFKILTLIALISVGFSIVWVFYKI